MCCKLPIDCLIDFCKMKLTVLILLVFLFAFLHETMEILVVCIKTFPNRLMLASLEQSLHNLTCTFLYHQDAVACVTRVSVHHFDPNHCHLY